MISFYISFKFAALKIGLKQIKMIYLQSKELSSCAIAYLANLINWLKHS